MQAMFYHCIKKAGNRITGPGQYNYFYHCLTSLSNSTTLFPEFTRTT
jgi:hypothetical protein